MREPVPDKGPASLIATEPTSAASLKQIILLEIEES